MTNWSSVHFLLFENTGETYKPLRNIGYLLYLFPRHCLTNSYMMHSIFLTEVVIMANQVHSILAVH